MVDPHYLDLDLLAKYLQGTNAWTLNRQFWRGIAERVQSYLDGQGLCVVLRSSLDEPLDKPGHDPDRMTDYYWPGNPPSGSWQVVHSEERADGSINITVVPEPKDRLDDQALVEFLRHRWVETGDPSVLNWEFITRQVRAFLWASGLVPSEDAPNRDPQK